MRRAKTTPASILLLVTLLLAGCWEVRDGPSPPDLAGQNSEIAQTASRLARIEEAMSTELEALRATQQTFFDEPVSAWSSPFPLDAFKHAAMSCLNEPFSEVEPEPHLREVADRLGISCAVPAADVLERALESSPQPRTFAEAKIQQIDEVRRARAELQHRLRQLPSIAQRTRNYLAARRAEARQLEADVERRRSEYARKDYEETSRRLAQYRAQLDALELAIRDVEQSIPRWSREVGDVVDTLYKDLSRLGRP